MAAYEECKHGMNPEWCADCLNHKSSDEEEDELLTQMVRNLSRFNTEESRWKM